MRLSYAISCRYEPRDELGLDLPKRRGKGTASASCASAMPMDRRYR